MLNNRTHTEMFDAFLRRMGVPVKSYKITDNHDSYWRGLQVTWYLATLLSTEEQRQYIGNTIAAIYFKDHDDEPFDPSQISQMGSIGVIHIVVTPVILSNLETQTIRYRVGVVYKDTLGEFGPSLPIEYLFDGLSIRDFVLTKVYNGYVAARSHPPLDRMFQQPRATNIKKIAEKFQTKSW